MSANAGPDWVVVAGAGGFIGGHLVKSLLRDGHRVRAVDIKPLRDWHQRHDRAENVSLDLSLREACDHALAGSVDVYNLAADMGGMGFIENNKALCMLSVLINTQLLIAAKKHRIRRFLFASSACVYNGEHQSAADLRPLRESDAYPAMPEDGYGWEKLFSERMCLHFQSDFGISVRIPRFHNVYGPYGTWDGGREKAPAAICRKVAQAKLDGRRELEIWGDGRQTRSFMYIDDCIDGVHRLMESSFSEPINLGSSELVSINQLVDLVETIAGMKLERRYLLDAPLGVRGRNSDNTLINARLGWEPNTSLASGLEPTYRWITEQMQQRALR